MPKDEFIKTVKGKALPDELRNFVDSSKWTFAKTMPEWPHEYIVRERADSVLFEALVHHIRQHGFEGRFYQRVITYFVEDGLLYWTMGAPIEETTIINRCRKEDSYENRLKNGTLPRDNQTAEK
ncbi:MAG: hypothetical protein EHM30_03180 [Desulfobacteraceae bacterium]|nr:MAG: hypothetical protein EHM30_03180 [Desulfobacteraceae bacterium]